MVLDSLEVEGCSQGSPEIERETVDVERGQEDKQCHRNQSG